MIFRVTLSNNNSRFGAEGEFLRYNLNSSVSSEFGDVDNDGDLDIVSADFQKVFFPLTTHNSPLISCYSSPVTHHS